MDVAVSRRRFTVDDYHRMGEVGILSPTDRVELIDGEIVSMTPIGPRHGASVNRTNRVLVTAVGTSAIVRVQGSVRLDLFHEPEPDIVLLRPRADFYASARILALRISCSSSSSPSRQSTTTETSRGASMRRPVWWRSWLVDLNEDVVHVHANPSNAVYRTVTTYRRGQSLAPRSLPSGVIWTADLLGRRITPQPPVN